MSKQLGWKGVAEGRANPLIDSWQPTFHMCPNRALIVAVEVADVIFPEILKIAAHDIERFNASISVCQACALDIYLADPSGLALLLMNDELGPGSISSSQT